MLLTRARSSRRDRLRLFCPPRGAKTALLYASSWNSCILYDHLPTIFAFLGPSRTLARASGVSKRWYDVACPILARRPVLVIADGSNAGTIQAYDVLKRTWGVLPSLPNTQWMVELNKRLVAVTIGSCLQYNPRSRAWTSLPAVSRGGSCRSDRFAIACVLNDALVVVSGYERGETVLMMYETKNSCWSELARLREPVSLASVGVLATIGPPILLFVGGDDDGRLVNVSISLDVSTRSWTCLPRLPEPHLPGAFCVFKNRLVIAGGWLYSLRESRTNQCRLFEYDTRQWHELPAIPGGFVSGLGVVDERLIAMVDDVECEGSMVARSSIILQLSIDESRWIYLTSIPKHIDATDVCTGRSRTIVPTTALAVEPFL